MGANEEVRKSTDDQLQSSFRWQIKREENRSERKQWREEEGEEE